MAAVIRYWGIADTVQDIPISYEQLRSVVLTCLETPPDENGQISGLCWRSGGGGGAVRRRGRRIPHTKVHLRRRRHKTKTPPTLRTPMTAGSGIWTRNRRP